MEIFCQLRHCERNHHKDLQGSNFIIIMNKNIILVIACEMQFKLTRSILLVRNHLSLKTSRVMCMY